MADFTLETLTLDAPRPGEVLVKVAAVGSVTPTWPPARGWCRSRCPPCSATRAPARRRGRRGVTKVAPGDKVALTFTSCGQCTNCTLGSPAYCYQFLPLNYAGARPDGSAPLTWADGPVHRSSSASPRSPRTRWPTSARGQAAEDAPLELVGPLGCRDPDRRRRGD